MPPIAKRLVLPRSWPRLRCKPIRMCESLFLPWEGDFSHFGQSTQGGMAYAAIYGGAPCGGHCFQPGKSPGLLRGCAGVQGAAGKISAPRRGTANWIFSWATWSWKFSLSRMRPSGPSYPEALGLRHLAFRVADAEAAVRALEERGIACEPLRMDEITGKRMTFFQDPDGLPLEIHE